MNTNDQEQITNVPEFVKPHNPHPHPGAEKAVLFETELERKERLIEKLPHQPSDIKHEEIFEREQEPPDPIPKEDLISAGSMPEILPHMHKRIRKINEEDQAQAQKPLPMQYLDKLRQYRFQANQRRLENKRINLEKIIEYTSERKFITNDDVERITGVGDSQAANYLNILVKNGKLIRKGRNRGTFYILNN